MPATDPDYFTPPAPPEMPPGHPPQTASSFTEQSPCWFGPGIVVGTPRHAALYERLAALSGVPKPLLAGAYRGEPVPRDVLTTIAVAARRLGIAPPGVFSRASQPAPAPTQLTREESIGMVAKRSDVDLATVAAVYEGRPVDKFTRQAIVRAEAALRREKHLCLDLPAIPARSLS